ncbi:MAG: LysM peptidoglycan-binding domain-containing protein [bacterium]|nr:LysM peptidoglycan-binding domain-containing protein [bacterium]
MRTICLFAIALLVLPLAAPAATADITLPGTRGITVENEVEFGPFADFTYGRHKVVDGDTLSEIAKQKLGSALRWQEIKKLNPDVKADALIPGTELRLPPKKAPATLQREAAAPKALPLWHFFADPGPSAFGDEYVALVHGDKLPAHRYGTSVFAVRGDQLAAFEKAYKAGGEDRGRLGKLLKDWAEQDGFAIADSSFPGRSSVSDGSPIRKELRRWQITAITGNKIKVKQLAVKSYDEKGEPVKGFTGLFGMNGLLLLLAFGALMGLVFLARRRPEDFHVPVASQ